jgi:hypothetical protein
VRSFASWASSVGRRSGGAPTRWLILSPKTIRRGFQGGDCPTALGGVAVQSYAGVVQQLLHDLGVGEPQVRREQLDQAAPRWLDRQSSGGCYARLSELALVSPALERFDDVTPQRRCAACGTCRELVGRRCRPGCARPWSKGADRQMSCLTGPTRRSTARTQSRWC